MAIVGQRLTLDEFLKLPEQKPALEYLSGSTSGPLYGDDIVEIDDVVPVPDLRFSVAELFVSLRLD